MTKSQIETWIREIQGKGFEKSIVSLDEAKILLLINYADASYYKLGQQSILQDAEYDLLRPALRLVNPDHPILDQVGPTYSADELRNKVTHPIAMGSLDNTDDGIDGLNAWHSKIGNHSLMASLKADGGSVRASYVDGVLTQVATRGNGKVGEDITINGSKFAGIPLYLPKKVTMDVRGEAILYVADYKAIRSRDLGMPFDDIPVADQSNPRNIGNGVFGRDSGEDAEKIRFLAFNVEVSQFPNQEVWDLNSEHGKFAFLELMGFFVVPHKLCATSDDVREFYEETLADRPNLDFEIDGVVVCVDSIAIQDSFITDDPKTRLRPKFARAIKFPHKSATTILLGCNLTHGHNGQIVPNANLQTVRIGGINNSNAFLNNWDEIQRLGVQIGDTVEVVLAGDIIPKVVKCVKHGANRQPIVEPSKCPACGSDTSRLIRGKKGAVTYCTQRSNCPPARKGKIKHWIGTARKGVGILGIGDGMLDALWDKGILKSAADLYTMDVAAIENITLDGGGRIGNSRATKIVDEIKSKRVLGLSTFLGALGIELLGSRRAEKLQQAAKGELDTLEQWRDFFDPINSAGHKIDGLGDAIYKSIAQGLDECNTLIDALLTNGVEIEKPIEASEQSTDLLFYGMTFCLTGTRECQDEIVALGGTLKSGVSKTLGFLVQKDPMSQSNKTQKADKYGVKVIGIEFLKQVIAGQAQLVPNANFEPVVPVPIVAKPKKKAKSGKKRSGKGNAEIDDLVADLLD